MAWLYKRPDSGVWWVGFRANGKQFLRSTGKRRREDAEKELAGVRAMFEAHRAGSLSDQVFEALTGKALARVTLWKALQEWLQECNTTVSEGTLEKYRRTETQFSSFVGATASGPLLRDVTSEQIRGYLTKKLATSSAATANLERKILTVFFVRAVRNGVLKDNPMLPVRPFKNSRRDRIRRRPFTLDELRLIYSKAPTPFWRYMILGGAFTGLRLGDLVCVVWGAIDFDQDLVRVTMGKTDRPVTIPLKPALRQLLLKRRRELGRVKASESVWPDEAAEYEEKGAGPFSNAFYDEILTPAGLVPIRKNKLKAKSGREAKREIVPVSFHSLRHSFVTLLKATGGNQAIAKELAGHTSDIVNDDYTSLPIDTLKQAIKLLPEVS